MTWTLTKTAAYITPLEIYGYKRNIYVYYSIISLKLIKYI